MAGRKSDFTLTKLDDLFTTQEQRNDEKLAKIRDIPLTEIDDFPNHPFKVRDDEDMQQLIESVKERGIITPATVRQKQDGRYELISGHRRKRACELAGFETLRCEVVDLDRDEATILMVESNYQRSQITNDGRKLALDQRMLNDMLPDFEGSKVNACVDNVYRIWQETADKKSAQLVFCDLSTPKNDGTFSVYDDIRKKLIERGIPASEVQFIHEADTDVKKKELFQKTRKGEVRVLLGSTQKMGAGTNVQDRLIALHDVDCPWRPSDLEQRSGRIIRQGNSNPAVDIYRYVTEQTFDAYLYQLVEGKQKFASQIMTSKSPVRSAEDIDETALSYAEIKMLATGNPYIKEKMDLDIQVQKLKLLKSNFLSEKYSLEDKIIKYYPQRIATLQNRIKGLTADVETAKAHPKPTDDRFIGMEVKGVFYSEKADAGKAILEACKAMTSPEAIPLGKYRGFETELLFDTTERSYIVRLKGKTSKSVSLGDDVHGNITRLDNGIDRFAEGLKAAQTELEDTKKQFETAKQEVQKPFAREDELKSKLARLDELNILLNMDKTENEIVVGEPDEGDEPQQRKEKSYER